MQRMHQSYKCMKAQKETKWVCIQLACSRIPRALLRKPIIGIYKPSSIMKDSHQYMKVTTQETLYHEDHGATLKHKCGKKIVALSLLSFSLIFYFFIWAFSLFYGLFSLLLFYLGFFGLFYLFIFVQSLIPTCGGIIVSIILSSLGQCSNNDDHHTFIYLQLKNYNSRLRTKYDSM